MRKTLTLVLAAGLVTTAALAPAAPPAQPTTRKTRPEQAEELFQAGRDALLKGQYAQAIKLLTKAADLAKEKTSYRLHLARAHWYAGRAGQARKLLEEILKTTPDHVEAGQLLAGIYAKEKDWKNVAALLERLLKYRHDYTTYHLLAEATYSLNDPEKARKYYEEAIKLNDRSATDHYQLGNIYLAGNFFALAAERYQSALSLGLDSPVLRYKLGSAYFNLRNYFGRIAQVTVKSGKTGTISKDWYLVEPVPGKKDVFRAAPSASAIYQIVRAIEEGLKDRPDIHFLRANIYLNAGRYRRAYEMFRKIEKDVAKEDKALYYYYYAQSAFGVEKYAEYLDLLRKAIKLDEKAYKATLVDAYLKVAEQYNQAGKLKEYIRYLTQAVAESPQTASLHLKLGDAYEEARQYGNAVVQWQMVLDLEPDHADRMQLLNRIEKCRGLAKPEPPAKPKRAKRAEA